MCGRRGAGPATLALNLHAHQLAVFGAVDRFGRNEHFDRRARSAQPLRAVARIDLDEDDFADVTKDPELLLARPVEDFADARLNAPAPSADRDDLRAHSIAFFDATDLVGDEEDRFHLGIVRLDPRQALVVE